MRGTTALAAVCAVALASSTSLATLSSTADVMWEAGLAVPGSSGSGDAGTTSASISDDYTGTNSLAETVTYTGDADAMADYGSLGTFAEATLTHGDEIGGVAPSFHLARGVASFEDTFPVPAGVTSITHHFSVTGETSFSSNIAFGNSNASILAEVEHAGAAFPFVRQWFADSGTPGGPVSASFSTTPYAVTPGGSYTVTFSLTSEVYFAHPGGPIGSLDASGLADAISTLVYDGPEFFDDTGKPVEGISEVTGDSGRVYSVFPEPSTLALLMAGGAFALRRRRGG